jgi:class 3 adenylate cyclase/tetratricopeptide (TPR) repeat protein
MRRQRPAEGERRTVTVLFVDAVGSTPLAEKLGEEEMYSLMRAALSRMSEAVHVYEGHVATFTGDGMMALFGAPIAHEDSARRGLAAALRMQASLDAYGREVEQRHGVGCRFRVGLNTGPVVVGTVTDDLRMDFTAIGDTVNLAARMEQMADPGSVLISEDTHRAAADFFECEALGELAVKGKVGRVPAYRVLREKPVRTRFEAAAERGLSPLVGRGPELAVLESKVKLAGAGAGQVVYVSGEAGIGKSRLILELRRRLTDVRWLEGHCASYLRNSAYLPFVDILKRAFGIEEGDDDARVIDRVDESVADWEEGARARVPYLKCVLAVDPGDAAVATMDPQERRIEVFEALEALIVQESIDRPLVIVVEDLHWADEMSQEALGRLLPAVAPAPVMLIMTHRPGYERAAGDFTVLELERLGEEESIALTEHVFDGNTLPPEVQSLVTAKAEGNPFYIEEVSKALIEAGIVARVNGGYQLLRPVEDVHLPGTIQEVILSRIDRLEREAKQAIQLASVIGREFTARVLQRISDLEAKLSEVLGQLKALELIYEKALFPELAYMFKHALTHDVAYATLLAERRRALHRLVGAAIEELYVDRLAEHHEALAHHYYEGQDWEKAQQYLVMAGDKAVAAYANQDALGFYDRALEVCETLGDPAVPAAAFLAAKRSFVNLQIGDMPGAITDLDRMAAAARRLGSRSLEGMALGYRGLMEIWNKDLEQAEATLGAARAIADEGHEDVRPVVNLSLFILLLVMNRVPEAEAHLISWDEAAALPDPQLAGFWNWWLGYIHYSRGDCDESLEVLGDMPEAAAQTILHRMFGRWIEGLDLATKGQYEAGLARFDEVLTTCERVGSPLFHPRVVNSVGWIYGELEDHERALQWNQSSLELASAPGMDPDCGANARLNMGDNLIALGRPEEAEEQFQIVEELARHPEPARAWFAWRYSQHLFHSYGELWLARGDLERAMAYADECVAVAEHNSSAKNVVKGRRLRGQVLMARDRLDEADQELSAALEVAAKVGNPPQLWKTHAAIGDLRRAQGRPAEAQRAYGQALAIMEAVARSVADERMRETLLHSQHIASIRRSAEAPA